MTSDTRDGMTLIELLVVLGLLGVLLGLLLPAVQNVRAAAARVGCQNNLKQVTLALHNYHDSYRHFPSGRPGGGIDPAKYPVVSWMALILAQIDQEGLYIQTQSALKSSHFNPFANPPHNGLAIVIKSYVCPLHGDISRPLEDKDGLIASYTSYIGVRGGSQQNGVMAAFPGTRIIDITDGTSSTLMVAERPPPDTLQAGKWYTWVHPSGGFWGMQYGPDEAMFALGAVAPGDPCQGPFRFGPGLPNNPCDRYHFWSLHSGGANFSFADGSVKFLSHSANNILPALATRAGGESVSVPD